MARNYYQCPDVNGVPARPEEEFSGEGKRCPAAHDGYGCTRDEGHKGRHVAHGINHNVLATWEDDEPADNIPSWERTQDVN